MCGRYVLARASGELARELDLSEEPEWDLRPDWNIAPTKTVPIVVETLVEGELVRKLGPARWGLLPPWVKDLTFSSRTFNARSETVAEKPSFRSAVRSRRAIVPADAYYEWRTETVNGKQIKRPHVIRPKDGRLLLFAGLWETWQDTSAGEDAPVIVSTTILTGPSPDDSANAEILRDLGALHDRTPLAMTPELASEWVRPGKLEGEDLHSLLDEVRTGVAEVAQGWEIYETNPAVGNTRNNGPELLEPADRISPALF